MAIIANLINTKQRVSPEQFDKYDIAMNTDRNKSVFSDASGNMLEEKDL